MYFLLYFSYHFADGVHPFYLELRDTTGEAHGVFLKNSNGMDVVLTEDSLQYKIIGGMFMWSTACIQIVIL